MKKSKLLFIGTAFVFCLVSCTAPQTLYSWANYDDASYKYLKNSDEKSTEQLIKTYQQIIEAQTGTRNVVPPGIYADYGFVLLQANRTEEGKAMLQKEVALYPESQVFIERILKMFEK